MKVNFFCCILFNKRFRGFPSPAGTSLTKLSPPGIIYLIPVPGKCGQNKSRNLAIFFYSVGLSESLKVGEEPTAKLRDKNNH